jgi:glycyl-tRNA synthetase (class II)
MEIYFSSSHSTPYTPLSSPQVLSLPPAVAPTKVLIVPLSAKAEFDPLVNEVCAFILLSLF